MSADGSLVEVRDLVFGYSYDRLICNNLNLNVFNNEVVGIMGPSGCGKSTLLRLISGFLRQQEGTINVDGRDVSAWSPQRRPTSMVFQSAALFPYLTVYENLAFGLRIKGVPGSAINEKVQYLLNILELENVKNAM